MLKLYTNRNGLHPNSDGLHLVGSLLLVASLGHIHEFRHWENWSMLINQYSTGCAVYARQRIDIPPTVRLLQTLHCVETISADIPNDLLHPVPVLELH